MKTARRASGIGITRLDPRNRIRTCRVCRMEDAEWLLRFEGEERASHGIKICASCLDELHALARERLSDWTPPTRRSREGPLLPPPSTPARPDQSAMRS